MECSSFGDVFAFATLVIFRGDSLQHHSLQFISCLNQPLPVPCDDAVVMSDDFALKFKVNLLCCK